MKFIAATILLAFSCLCTHAQEPSGAYDEGNKFLEKGKYKDAIRLYSKAIEADDHQPTYFFKRAMAYKSTKELQHSFDDLTRAIKLDGTYAEAFLERSVAFNSAAMHQDALNDLDMAVKYAKTDSLRYKSLLARSGVRLAVRNFKGAYEDSRAFYDHDTTSRDALVNMAMSKLEMDKPEEALSFLKEIISAHPKDTMVLMNIGYVNIRMENYDSALVYLEQSYKMDSRNAYALSNMSFAKLKLGRTKEALKDVNTSLSIFPSNSYAYRNRALIYIKMGEIEKACIDLHTAVKNGFTEEYGTEVRDLIYENCQKK